MSQFLTINLSVCLYIYENIHPWFILKSLVCRVALQCCLAFCSIAKRISSMYTRIPSVLDFSHLGHRRARTRVPAPPSRSAISYIFYTQEQMRQSRPSSSHPTPSPVRCPCLFSASVHLLICMSSPMFPWRSLTLRHRAAPPWPSAQAAVPICSSSLSTPFPLSDGDWCFLFPVSVMHSSNPVLSLCPPLSLSWLSSPVAVSWHLKF